MLALFGNTLTAGRMYSPHNSHKFLKLVQTPLAPKVKTFLKNVFAFSKFT